MAILAQYHPFFAWLCPRLDRKAVPMASFFRQLAFVWSTVTYLALLIDWLVSNALSTFHWQSALWSRLVPQFHLHLRLHSPLDVHSNSRETLSSHWLSQSACAYFWHSLDFHHRYDLQARWHARILQPSRSVSTHRQSRDLPEKVQICW